jgi:hypothetical protein
MSDEEYGRNLIKIPTESEDQAERDQREWYALIPIGTLAVLGIVLYAIYLLLWSL